ncbi:MAG: AAA family ATPase [Labilithrix sp.]|nr:AAA family ATPase [Labilithrix sp.]MCW5818011.1 AAA family ATPase [Labilithrix sp.]
MRGDENNSDNARRFIAGCRELARECGCPIMIVHHTNKGGAHGETCSARGSVQLTCGPRYRRDDRRERRVSNGALRRPRPRARRACRLQPQRRPSRRGDRAARRMRRQQRRDQRGRRDDDLCAHPRDGLPHAGPHRPPLLGADHGLQTARPRVGLSRTWGLRYLN